MPEPRQPLRFSWLVFCALATAGLISGLAIGAARPTDLGLSIPPIAQFASEIVSRLVAASLPEAAGEISTLPGSLSSQSSQQGTAPMSPGSNIVPMSERIPIDHNAEQQMLVPGWSQPRNLSNSPARVVNPVLLAGSGGQLHALWEEDNRIYHTFRRDGVWSTPTSMATGFEPAASLAADGRVHLVFSSQFFGQYRVFHAVWNGDYWSLPILVSKTSGNATSPALAIDRSGLVHASWADSAPGFSIIYHGWLESTWLNEPIQNARGDIPALAADGKQDKLYLSYQGASISGGKREVYFAEGHVYSWQAPENVSLTPASESVDAALAVDGESKVHLLWQETVDNRAHILYRSGRQSNWSAVEDLSGGGQDAHHATVAVTQGGQINVVWQQGTELVFRNRFAAAHGWDSPKALVSNDRGLGEPVLAGAPNGEINLVWTGWTGASERDLFLSQHAPILRPKMFIPSIVKGR